VAASSVMGSPGTPRRGCARPGECPESVPAQKQRCLAGGTGPRELETQDRPPTHGLLYRLARFLGDCQAVKNGRVGKRIARRTAGRITGRRARATLPLSRALLGGTHPLRRVEMLGVHVQHNVAY
jgi:hypothetical protein